MSDIEIIHGILTASDTFTTVDQVSSKAYRIFSASGRPAETISGLMYQHYGFRSLPPVGVEVLTLQYGNNNVSMAENDGSLNNLSGTVFPEGSVSLYIPYDKNDNGPDGFPENLVELINDGEIGITAHHKLGLNSEEIRLETFAHNSQRAAVTVIHIDRNGNLTIDASANNKDITITAGSGNVKITGAVNINNGNLTVDA